MKTYREKCSWNRIGFAASMLAAVSDLVRVPPPPTLHPNPRKRYIRSLKVPVGTGLPPTPA